MPTNPLISIIIPCYNCELYVTDTVNSVFKQDYRPLEVICVNDGSKDNTLKILNSIVVPDGIYFNVITIENKGASAARNIGFNQSKGEIIQFLDADDLITKEKLSSQFRGFDDKVDIVLSDYTKMDAQLVMENSKSDFSSILSNPVLCALRDVITSLNPIYRRSLIEKWGGYDEKLPCSQDWEFNLRLILSGARLKFVPGNFSVIRQVNGSISSDFGKIAVQCGRILLKLENELKKIMAKSEHEIVIAKWYYEAAIHSTKEESIQFLEKVKLWSPEFKFLSSSKNALRKILGNRFVLFLDRKRK